MRVVDLFAGAGGLTEGFVRAGFNPILAVEQDKDACETLRSRGHRVIQATITEDNIVDLLSGIRPDVIVAGLPCQAYSIAGRACMLGLGKDLNSDCRRYYYKAFAKALMYTKPLAFVVENVPGLLYRPNQDVFDDMLKRFRQAGYKVFYKVLDASDYGVAQKRKRLFIVGIRGEKFEFPEPLPYKVTVREALQGLPEPDVEELQHVARRITPKTREIYRLFIQAHIEGRKMTYLDLPAHLRPKRQEGFLDRYRVINLDAQSPTIVAHLSKDGNSFIYPDIKNPRSLTVREVARLQSFPDDYKFHGGMSSAFKQIGNAVPVKLAEAVAKSLSKSLKGKI